jgi:hypothetical protein
MTSRLFLLVLATTAFAAPPEPKFRAVTIDPAIQIGYGVAVADVDGDKAPDVLLADKKQVVWYRNPGPAKAADPAAWTKFVIAENLTEKDNVCLAAQDLDGDGKCEIAVGAEWNPGDTEKSGAVFYLIAPADRTRRWEPVKFPAVEPTTHRMKWTKLDDHKNEWGLVVCPLHGRGNKNGEGAPVKVLCYHKPADVRAEWQAEVVDESMHMTHNFDVGKTGLLLGGKEMIAAPSLSKRNGGTSQWLIVAEKTAVRWDGVPCAPGIAAVKGFDGAGEVRWARRADDKLFFASVEPMHGNSLIAYWNIYDAGAPTRHVLTDQLTEGHALACGDVLGAGSDQIVVGWRGNPQKPKPVGIKLFTPLDEKGEQWRESFIDDNEMACEDLVLADLNGDGKLDVVASGRATHNVKLYFNETAR